jgi:hypothetical protein
MRDKSLIVVVLFLVGSLIGSSIYIGRLYERRVGKKLVPEQMDLLCEQCQNNGIMMGFRNGVSKCDDVLNTLDDGGHR